MAEIILKKEEKESMDEMKELMKGLTEEEKKEINSLIRGVIFGVQLARNEELKKVKKGA